MAKKKDAPIGIALFDDEVPASKNVKQDTSKSSPKTSKKASSTKISKSSKEVKASPKEDKKQIKQVKKNVVDKNTAGNTSSRRNITGNKRNISKKEDKEDGGRKPKRASSSSKKSGSVVKSTPKDTNVNKSTAKKSVKLDKPTKSNIDKEPTGGSKKSSSRSTKSVSSNDGEKQTAAKPISPDFNEAKKNKHVFKRGTEIWGPKQITGKPKPVKDGELVAIIINGEYLEVSPWSVKDGIYHQGLDSNFLVKYLYYEPIATKYDEYDKKLAESADKKTKQSKKK